MRGERKKSKRKEGGREMKHVLGAIFSNSLKVKNSPWTSGEARAQDQATYLLVEQLQYLDISFLNRWVNDSLRLTFFSSIESPLFDIVPLFWLGWISTNEGTSCCSQKITWGCMKRIKKDWWWMRRKGNEIEIRGSCLELGLWTNPHTSFASHQIIYKSYIIIKLYNPSSSTCDYINAVQR